MDKKLLDILVCPACKKSALEYRKQQQELWCRACRLAYSVRTGIPVMLAEEARRIELNELDK